MRYLVSYDLKLNKNYQRLYSSLSSLRAEKIHASLWGVDSNLSIDQIAHQLKNATDWDDEIMIFPAPSGHLVREKNLRARARDFLNGGLVFGLAGLFR